jgi:membrane protein implicated in regulation of membrane protease activity
MPERMRSLPPNPNPFVRALTLVIAAVAVGVSMLFGFIAFLILAGMALVLVIVVSIRVWWLRHNIRRHMQDQQRQPPGEFIEGEYEVKDDSRHHSTNGN